MEQSEPGLFEAIHTARALRRLKPDPVPEPLITRVLDAAIRAGSAGNAQNWVFMVVREESLRRGLGEIYRKASKIAEAMYAARGRPAHLTETQFARLMNNGAHLWEHMGEAPVILIPCLRRPVVPPAESLPEAMRDRHEAELVYAARIRGASIYPAVQNIILACRESHPLRERCPRASEPSRRSGYLCDDAHRLADRCLRSPEPPPLERGGVRGSLGEAVARGAIGSR
jgi:nitroreductase